MPVNPPIMAYFQTGGIYLPRLFSRGITLPYRRIAPIICISRLITTKYYLIDFNLTMPRVSCSFNGCLVIKKPALQQACRLQPINKDIEQQPNYVYEVPIPSHALEGKVIVRSEMAFNTTC
jgi:hypothetical protein